MPATIIVRLMAMTTRYRCSALHQIRGACFRLYELFWSLHTRPEPSSEPLGCLMTIFRSFILTMRNAITKSTYQHDKPRCSTITGMKRIDSMRITGAKVPQRSRPNFFMLPQIAKRALRRRARPVSWPLTLKIQFHRAPIFHPIILFPIPTPCMSLEPNIRNL